MSTPSPLQALSRATVDPGLAQWSARPAIRLGLVALALLIGGPGLWGATARISGAVIASGQVEVQQNHQIVQHVDGGRLEEIAVREGARVSNGALLARLDGTQVRSELAIVESQYFETLARRDRLTAERDAQHSIEDAPELLAAARQDPQLAEIRQSQHALFAARNAAQAQQITQLDLRQEQIMAQITGLRAQIAALDTQLALLDEELVAQQILRERGLAQSARVLALQREASRLQGNIAALQAEIALAGERMAEVALERLALAGRRREAAEAALGDLGLRQRELAERRRALQAQLGRLELRAPVSGVVMGLQHTTPGAVLRPAQPLLHIIPQDRPLVLALRLDPASVGHVHVGQNATVVLAATGLRNTPPLEALVTQVSADAFTDEHSWHGFFRVELALTPAALAQLENQQIMPGMPAEAFIRTGPRTPLAYLLQPVTDYFRRAFREP